MISSLKIFLGDLSMKKQITSAVLALALILTGCSQGANDSKTDRTQYKANIKVGTVEKAGDLLTVEGEEEITFKNYSKDTWDNIVLRDYNPSNLAEEKANADGEYHTAITGITQDGKDILFHEEQDPSVVTITLANAVKPGKTGKVSVKFSMKVPKGACRQSYSFVDKDSDKPEDIVIALGPFLPTLPVYENGGWAKDPYFSSGECFYTKCADYDVHMEVPEGYEACATGSEKRNDDGSFDFKATNVRDFSILTGKNLAYFEENVDGVSVKVWYYENNEATQKTAKDDMLPAAVNSLKVYNDYFGKYAYEDLDVVICSYAYGGMESPAFVRINDDFAYPNTDMNEDQRHHHLVESLVHEIGHEWFYSAIGNDQYNEAWLDEAFATLAAQIYFDKTGDGGHDTESTANSWKNAWISAKSLKIDLSYAEIDKHSSAELPTEYCYTFTVYSGGASFLCELQKAMGEDDFKALLQEWYSTNLNKEVTTKQFLELVVKKAGKEKVNDLLTKYFSPENIPA